MSSSSGSAGPNWMERHPVMFAFSGLIIGALITATATYASQDDDDADDRKNVVATTEKPSGEITAPAVLQAGSTVHLSGWIKNVPDGYALWSYSEQVSSGKLWPQYAPCKINKDKTAWECPDLRVDGKGEGPGSGWQVRVALVTALDVVDIKAYAIAKEYKNEHPDGFASLPSDAIPIDEMQIIPG
ncbi:hypothetical protein [Streptomyces nigra]|uniref:hypothetical protein n=1 Tax=Streptomyces nigra TaxID=1827580 RepID=UPI003626DEB2